MNKKYIGYNAADWSMIYAKFFNDKKPKPSQTAQVALEESPYTADLFLDLCDAADLQKNSYMTLENGYVFKADGSVAVAVLTSMPNVTPAMWHWWFGWHGCADNRYKLWHPKAHLSAEWQDGDDALEAYIGRTSVIQEYIGTKLEKANIRFIAPEELGLKNTENAVYICARLGYTDYPLDFGWLVHQVRRVEGGAEMRSRFWIGGKYIQIRRKGKFFAVLTSILQKTYRLSIQQSKDLLQHCSEEMNHLATFLPAIYAEFNNSE